MSTEEYKRELESIRKFNKEVASSPEKARAVLMKIGVLDAEGDFTEGYKDQSHGGQSPKSDSGLSRDRKIA